MSEPVFSGSSEISKNDLKECAVLTAFGNVTGTIIKLVTGFMLALAVLFLIAFMLPNISRENSAAYLRIAVMCLIPVVFTAVFKHKIVSGKVNAPINQNVHALVRLYEDSLEYSTEYVALSAKYSDVKKLHMGKYSMVLELNGADSIMIPLRCFGWNNYKAACDFLRKKLREQGV